MNCPLECFSVNTSFRMKDRCGSFVFRGKWPETHETGLLLETYLDSNTISKGIYW